MSVIAGGVVAGFFTDPFKIAECAYLIGVLAYPWMTLLDAAAKIARTGRAKPSPRKGYRLERQYRTGVPALPPLKFSFSQR
jgi:hypothetical protein